MTGLVRLFRPADGEAVLHIGAETAFFGEPVEAFLEDRRIFRDAFYAYYTGFEPEHCWVACEAGQVVGFLTGCFDTRQHDRVFRRRILPAVFGGWLAGNYRVGPKTARYFAAAVGAALHGEIAAADISRYPAHLHINLLPGARGKGLGRSLMAHYLGQLREAGVPGVHLQTTSLNVIACRLYETAGFALVAEKPTRMYAHLVPQPVTTRCYGMKIC